MIQWPELYTQLIEGHTIKAKLQRTSFVCPDDPLNWKGRFCKSSLFTLLIVFYSFIYVRMYV